MKILSQDYFKEMRGIFSCAAFCVYSWSIFIFLWDVPSFLLKFTVSDILGFLSYQLMYALFESVVITFLVTGLVFIIPIKHVKTKISSTGALFLLSFAISAIVFKQIVPIVSWLSSAFSLQISVASQITFALWLFTILGLPVFSVVAVKSNRISTAIANFSENLSILTGLYVLLSIAGTFIVIYRNLP